MEIKRIDIIIDIKNNEVSTVFINCDNNVFCAQIALNALQKFLKDNDAL